MEVATVFEDALPSFTEWFRSPCSQTRGHREVVQQEALTMDKSAEQFRAALDHSVAGVNRLIVEP